MANLFVNTILAEDELEDVMYFVDMVSKANNATPEAPIVVHCSAGIGRTGTFIMIDDCIGQINGPNRVADIAGTLCRMRAARGGLVQSPSQYEFVHRVFGRTWAM